MSIDWHDDIIGVIEALQPCPQLALMPEDNPLWRKLAQSTSDADCRRVSGAHLLARHCAQ